MRTLAVHAARELRTGNLELVPVATAHGQRLLLYGELDIGTAPDLLAAARAALRTPCSVLELDLGALDFLDSSGLGAVLEIEALCVERAAQLVLLAPRRNARRLLCMARVSTRLVVRDV